MILHYYVILYFMRNLLSSAQSSFSPNAVHTTPPPPHCISFSFFLAIVVAFVNFVRWIGFRRRLPSVHMANRLSGACFRNAAYTSSDRAFETYSKKMEKERFCVKIYGNQCSKDFGAKRAALTLHTVQLITNAFWAAFFCSVAL